MYPSSNLTREGAIAQRHVITSVREGMCISLHLPIPSHSIASPRDVYDCLQNGSQQRQSALETPHRAQKNTPEPGKGLENGLTGKADLSTLHSDPICSAPALALPPCVGWSSTPLASRRNTGARRQETLLDIGLISPRHMGPWMLPPALVARGWGATGAPPTSSLRLTCSFALWFLVHASVKTPKASPRLPGKPRQRRQSCPASPQPHGTPRLGDVPQISYWPRHAPPAPARPHKHLWQP